MTQKVRATRRRPRGRKSGLLTGRPEAESQGYSQGDPRQKVRATRRATLRQKVRATRRVTLRQKVRATRRVTRGRNVSQKVRATRRATRGRTLRRNTGDGENCAHPLRNPSHRQEEGRSGRRDAGHESLVLAASPALGFPGAWRLHPGALQLRKGVPGTCFVIFSV